MLQISELTKDFGGLRAVDHCSFDIERGMVFGLIGPNGSGKTTVFNLITGLLKPTKGEVYFKGKKVTGLPPYQIVQRGIGRTFQTVRVFGRMTVMENLLLGPKDQTGENVLLGTLGVPIVRKQEKEGVERALELLDVVGLRDVAGELCQDLPYAEQKMVEITRALMTNPELILLDEPTAGINPTLVNDILDYIRRLRDQRGKTFLVVEHDMRVIMNLCDHIAVLNHGKKIAEGTPEEVSSDAKVIDAYLGV